MDDALQAPATVQRKKVGKKSQDCVTQANCNPVKHPSKIKLHLGALTEHLLRARLRVTFKRQRKPEVKCILYL